MDKIKKALTKLKKEEHLAVAKILQQIMADDFALLDIKKLKGHDQIYRVRKGKIRIIYRHDDVQGIFILGIERRNDHTYDF